MLTNMLCKWQRMAGRGAPTKATGHEVGGCREGGGLQPVRSCCRWRYQPRCGAMRLCLEWRAPAGECHDQRIMYGCCWHSIAWCLASSACAHTSHTGAHTRPLHTVQTDDVDTRLVHSCTCEGSQSVTFTRCASMLPTLDARVLLNTRAERSRAHANGHTFLHTRVHTCRQPGRQAGTHS